MENFSRVEAYFSHIAKYEPNRIAIKEGESSFTYDQLDRLSTHFSYHLIAHGVLLGDFIPIIANKSSLVIIAILGILKAGAAYIPISSDFPLETIVSILQEVAPRCICIDDSCSRQNLNLTQQSTIIPLSSALNEPENAKEKKAIVGNNNEAYAYMVFTSGSTGVPNGVLVSHDNLIATVTSWLKAYELTPDDRHLQMANISFDVFAGDWLRALCSGGTLVLCDKSTLLSPQKLYSLVVKENITVAEFVPAILRILIKYCNKKNYNLAAFRLLICGSDSWTMAEYRQVKALCKKTARVVSSYGLTETTIDSTYFEEEEDCPLSNEALVPLGKPFPHVLTRIVNEFFETVALGESGELLIGGKGVAKGYFRHPMRQSERFVHDLDENHGMVFRTGDCVKMLANGDIYFEGRNIHCININGVRVDINSLEAVLKNHPKVSEALVTINNKQGQLLLMYYLTLEDETVTYDDLITYLNTTFKKIILPHNFYIVQSLGLTFNNKVNRKFAPDKVLRVLSPAIA